mgnify:CR=1 FL=1
MSPSEKFTGLRILVVEDEALVAMNLEMILEDLGCVVVGPAMRFDQAEQMMHSEGRLDVAILDVNLGGQPVYPLANHLKETGIPIIFATGYDVSGIPEEWHGWPTLKTPYSNEDVEREMARALGV